MASLPAAPRDGNNIPGKLAVLNTDTVQGQNLVILRISALSGGIKVVYGGTINFTPVPVDPRDPNYVNVWLFQGEDGLCYPAVANADGKWMIQSD